MIEKKLFDKIVQAQGIKFGSDEEREWLREAAVSCVNCKGYAMFCSYDADDDENLPPGMHWRFEWDDRTQKWYLVIFNEYPPYSRDEDLCMQPMILEPGTLKETLVTQVRCIVESMADCVLNYSKVLEGLDPSYCTVVDRMVEQIERRRQARQDGEHVMR